ncbi:MAG TPA: hypothetical protein VFN48_00880 [Solirubrobacteraceae bacterium]|nr:hypothetical protein [Solirubrobacteraceae bacterium]
MSLIAAAGTDFLNLHQSVKFVAGAYIVVLAVIVVYLAIMAKRLITNQRELTELRRLVDEREAAEGLAGGVGFGLDTTAETSAQRAEEHERAAEAIRSEHQL